MSDEQNKSSQREQVFPEPTVGPIIYNDKGEILLTKCPKWKNDVWTIPGGHVELGETSEEALKREIREETGLEIDKIEFIGWQDAINPPSFHKPRHFLFLDFCAHLAGGEIKKSDEMTEYVWIQPEQAIKELKIDSFTVKTIEFYLNHLHCAHQENYLANWKRALADYDNLKRETTREKAEMVKFAQAMSAMNFIEVYDNYKKALAHKPNAADSKSVEQWFVGVEHIKKQFVETLKQLGIEEIKTVGEKFDPAMHEAVGEEVVEGGDEGQIVKEIEGGYKMGEKVIKAAKVIVCK
ncbi:MAG: nucleotide exchange factor GrpE [Patescibacteria group bacterium]